jgi:hypothetical protein
VLISVNQYGATGALANPVVSHARPLMGRSHQSFSFTGKIGIGPAITTRAVDERF